MKRLRLIIGGLIGAVMMFFMDPQRGNRRRALLRDQMTNLANKTEDVVDAKAEDLKNRAQDVVTEAKNRFKEEPLSDQVMTELVRSEMGRVITNAAAIDVSAHEGKVILRGPIPADKVDALLSAIDALPGVKQIENRLEVQEEPGTVSSPQVKRNISTQR